MDYEWDEDKRQSNLEKHDVDLLDAVLIFSDWVYTTPDNRHDYGERRWKSIGVVDGKCYVVIHTERSGHTRLISAWKGGRNDRRKYQASLAGGNPEDEGTR